MSLYIEHCATQLVLAAARSTLSAYGRSLCPPCERKGTICYCGMNGYDSAKRLIADLDVIAFNPESGYFEPLLGKHTVAWLELDACWLRLQQLA